MSQSNASSKSYSELVQLRMSRRAALLGLASAATLAATAGLPRVGQAAPATSLKFEELKKIYDQTHHVAPGYEAKVLVRWGDPLVAGADFDPAAITADRQSKQFGYNCDFVGYMRNLGLAHPKKIDVAVPATCCNCRTRWLRTAASYHEKLSSGSAAYRPKVCRTWVTLLSSYRNT